MCNGTHKFIEFRYAEEHKPSRLVVISNFFDKIENVDVRSLNEVGKLACIMKQRKKSTQT